jgi:hypothetical protein
MPLIDKLGARMTIVCQLLQVLLLSRAADIPCFVHQVLNGWISQQYRSIGW